MHTSMMGNDLLAAFCVDVRARVGRNGAPERPVGEAEPKPRPTYLDGRSPGHHYLAARIAAELDVHLLRVACARDGGRHPPLRRGNERSADTQTADEGSP